MAKKWIWVLSTVVIGLVVIGLVVTVFVIFLGIKTILDQSEIKNLVQNKIRAYFELDVEYETIESNIFPYPAIQISGLKISENKAELCYLESLNLKIDIVSLFENKLVIQALQIKNGKSKITKFRNGDLSLVRNFKSDSEDLKSDKERIEEGPKTFFEALPLVVQIENFEFFWHDETTELSNKLVFQKLEIESSPNNLQLKTIILGNLDGNQFGYESEIQLTENNWDWKLATGEAKIKLTDWNLSTIGDLNNIFPKTDLSNSKINLDLKLKKPDLTQVHLNINHVSITGFKNSPLEAETNFKSDLTFDTNNLSTKWKNTEVWFAKHSNFQIEGDYSSNNNHLIQSSVVSDKINLDKLILLKDYVTRIDTAKSKYFSKQNVNNENNKTNRNAEPIKILLTTNIKEFSKEKLQIKNIVGKIEINPAHNVQIHSLHCQSFGGNIQLAGNYYIQKQSLHIKPNIKHLNLLSLFSYLDQDPILLGNLDSESDLIISLKPGGDFLDKLSGTTNFKISDGKLLGYANFIKPVAELGKILNFNGPKGESTEFQELTGDIIFENQNLNLKSIKMLGIGLSAEGGGVYSKSGKIDMKFTVALSGFVGKMIKLPILYKGVYGKNIAYIDPIWLASVYTGTIFLGGPAGTMVGGIAGSGASETVDKSIDSAKEGLNKVKSFFWD
ncbi:AsmA-like C-terminal region-containing protein [Leptospira sp. 96542]|nr:AsmA-like C-terminal region-containing protein [Leptospira sp. 96542]